MAIKLLPTKEQIPLFITLATVILLGLGYYYIYLPGNEEDLQKWKFRTLHNIDKNIHEKIENGDKLLATYLKNRKKLVQDINSLNKDLAIIRTDSFPIGSVAIEKNVDPKRKVVIDEQKQLVLTHEVDTTVQGKIQRFNLSLTYKFETFIKPLLPEEVFDQYIIVGAPGVLYESFPTGLHNSTDSLIIWPDEISNSKIINREFGGLRYKLFVQPVNCSDNTRILVIGLVTNENYQHARSKLPAAFVLLLILIFTAIIVTFPIIKLYQLGSEDRLTASDALSCTIVAMILVSLLSFTFLKVSSIYSYRNSLDPKEILADAITDSLAKEIKTYSDKLIAIDQLIIGNDKLDTILCNVGKENPMAINGREIPDYKLPNKLVNGIALDRVFWMDPTGQEIISWKSDNKRVYFPGKFNSRAYFRNIIRNQGYDLKLDSKKTIYLDQVISWISGQFLSDISTESSFSKRNAKVVVISFTAKSVDQIKIPPGYLFAVIDQTGKVLYHSNKTKNLNENLFEEFSNSKGLINSIKTAYPDAFKTNYFGKEYAVRVKTMRNGLPYYIVILDDLRFEDSRDVDVHSFTFSMQLLLLILVLIQMLILFFASARRSVFKAQRFDTRWLSPKISYRREYFIASGFNVWIFIAICISHIFLESIISRLFTLLFSITLLPVLLNLIYFKKHHDPKAGLRKNNKFWPVVFSGLVPALIFIIGIVSLRESRWSFFWFQIVAVVLPLASIVFAYQPNSKPVDTEQSGSSLSFTCLVFSWMFVVNALPIIFFFTSAYNYDQHLIARYKQLELARKTVQEANRIKGDRIERGESKVSKEPESFVNSNIENNFYKDLYWIKSSEIRPDTSTSIPQDDSIAVDLLNSFHIYDANSGVYNRDLNKVRAFDFSFFFNNLMKQVNEQSDVTETYFRLNSGNNHLKIISSNLNLKLPPITKWWGIFLWSLFVILLVGLFFLIHGMINKIFSLNIPVTKYWKSFDRKLLKEGNKYTFLINISEADLDEYLLKVNKICKSKGQKTCELDMSLIPGKDHKESENKSWNAQLINTFENKYDLIFIKHFEYNFRDPYTSDIKLSALEKILHKAKKSKVVILSTIRPATLISVMNEADAQLTDKHSIEKWQQMMSRFKIVIRSLSERDTLNDPALLHNTLKEDSLTFKEQTSNYHSYYSIWQSLSKEEKFLLYDLAEDGLVNSYDKNTICMLINKGIIVQDDGAIRLFSKAFRNFVLTGIGEIETAKIMEKVNDNRNWNKIKMPLALISLTIAAFILSSQHEASTKLITTLGTLAALVPTLINFLATLSGSSTTKKA